MTSIPIDRIRTDRPRPARLCEDTVKEYAEAYRRGDQFPAVIVFHEGPDYWMADGFHRLADAKAAGLKTINADVREGRVRIREVKGVAWRPPMSRSAPR